MRRSVFSDPAFVLAVLLATIFSALPANAQWVTQEIPLSPGWNGVQLLVQPAQAECAAVFSNKPVEKVFWWKRTGAGMEFDLDPRDPFPRTADWQYWFATNSAISTFGSLMAGESYAIRVAASATRAGSRRRAPRYGRQCGGMVLEPGCLAFESPGARRRVVRRRHVVPDIRTPSTRSCIPRQ
jgi:hypothetical protein